MAGFGAPLCKVDVYASCVLSSPFDATWQLARDFQNAPWWSQATNGQFKVVNTSGGSGTEVGQKRMFTVGTSRLFEELTALDDMEHIVRWMVVSHPKTLSPFESASFLNYNSSLQLRPVTVSNETFAEWTGHFYTEAIFAESMQKTLESWYYAGFQGLQATAQYSHHLAPTVDKQDVNTSALINPRHSIPIAPPSSDQVAFHGPGANGIPHQTPNGVQASSSGQEQLRSSQALDDQRTQFAQDPRTRSSQSWQQAKAVFGNPNPSRRRGAGASSNSSASLKASSPEQNKMPPKFQSSGRPVNNIPVSSASPRSISRSSAMPGNPLGVPDTVDPRVIIGDTLPVGSPGYAHRRMDPILESQLLDTRLSTQATQSLSESARRESLNSRRPSNGSDLISDAKSSSLGSEANSNGAGSSMHSGGKHTPWTSGQGKDEVKANKQLRHSLQQNHTGINMVGDKMKAMDITRHPSLANKHTGQKGDVEMDLQHMKEVAYVNTDEEAQIMAGVADQYRRQHQNSIRSSLEEEVARLQERQNRLHKNTGNKQYTSPFSASPFGAPPSNPSNPFAAAQTPFSS